MCRPQSAVTQSWLSWPDTPPTSRLIGYRRRRSLPLASGDLGFTWGHFTATSHDSTGKLVTDHGKYLDVWRRQSDGSWRWIADIGTGGDGDASPNESGAPHD